MNNCLNRKHAITQLKNLRLELEEAALEIKGLPLAETTIGMLLAEVSTAIGLSADEQLEVLGFTSNLSVVVQPPVSHVQQLEFPQMAAPTVYI